MENEDFKKEYEEKISVLKNEFTTIFKDNEFHLDEKNMRLFALNFFKAGQISQLSNPSNEDN